MRWSQGRVFRCWFFVCFFQTYRLAVGQTGAREHSQNLPKLPHPFSRARSRPHLYGKTCGAGGHQDPQRVAAAPAPPRPEAATSQVSISASAVTGRAPARIQITGSHPQICTQRCSPLKMIHWVPGLPPPLILTFLVVSGLPRREEPGSRRGRPSASASRHSRYSGDLTKRA